MSPAEAFLREIRPRVERELERALPPESEPPAELHKAMRYAVFGGGKRLRPALVLAGCRAVGGHDADALPAAAALELLHTYSLVHDDLPCMDDDDWRRGRRTCHKVFGDATAVLAGDGLLTLSFQWLAEQTQDAGRARDAIVVLGRAAGSVGMVGGQEMDVKGEGQTPDRALVEQIHRRKTAALIAASLEIGAVLGGARPAARAAIAEFGTLVGLAFQVVDDCLDVTGSLSTLGKAPGQDAAAGKQTFPRVLGLERSQELARELRSRASARLASTQGLDSGRALLDDLAGFVVDRQA